MEILTTMFIVNESTLIVYPVVSSSNNSIYLANDRLIRFESKRTNITKYNTKENLVTEQKLQHKPISYINEHKNILIKPSDYYDELLQVTLLLLSTITTIYKLLFLHNQSGSSDTTTAWLRPKNRRSSSSTTTITCFWLFAFFF